MTLPACYRLSPSGLSLFIRVTPNAGRDAIEGVEVRDDGRVVLRLRVSAVPDKGRANAAAVALLANVLGVPKAAIAVTSGHTARLKTLAITGDGPALAAAVSALSSISP